LFISQELNYSLLQACHQKNKTKPLNCTSQRMNMLTWTFVT